MSITSSNCRAPACESNRLASSRECCAGGDGCSRHAAPGPTSYSWTTVSSETSGSAVLMSSAISKNSAGVAAREGFEATGLRTRQADNAAAPCRRKQAAFARTWYSLTSKKELHERHHWARKFCRFVWPVSEDAARCLRKSGSLSLS